MPNGFYKCIFLLAMISPDNIEITEIISYPASKIVVNGNKQEQRCGQTNMTIIFNRPAILYIFFSDRQLAPIGRPFIHQR